MTYIQEAITLLNHSGFAQFADVNPKQNLTGQTAVVQPIHIGQMLLAYQMGEIDTYHNVAQESFVNFRKALEGTFNDDDLHALCFDLNIEYENLPGKTMNQRLLELIDYGKRNGLLADLVAYCRRERPYTVWPDFPNVKTITARPKDELAVVICITHLVLQRVADFLMGQGTDCNYLLIATSPDYAKAAWLPEDQKWGPAVSDFYQIMQKATAQKRHFFFAAPNPYVFAIGAAWGLVNDGDELYHWDGAKYVHVMTSAREWKQ